MPRPLIPRALQEGDTIAFISPSARLNHQLPQFITRATDLFTKRLNYKVRVIYKGPDSSIQSSIANRLSEIREAFADPTIRAIICTIGGSSFTELLPALLADWELQGRIRADPKIVVGYSDITGLHWFLHATTGLRTFYGPGVIPELGLPTNQSDWARSKEDQTPFRFCLEKLLLAISGGVVGPLPPRPLGDIARSTQFYTRAFPLSEPDRDPHTLEWDTPRWEWIRPGKSQGRLFGGCLTVVARLNGITQIVPDWRNRIIFLETATGDGANLDQGNPIERVRAGFADLIAQGVFEQAVGLVVGRPFGYHAPEKKGQQYRDAIRDLFCESGSLPPFPILFGVDFGHTIPMVTLPYDAMAVLDSEEDRFAVLEAGVV